MDERVGTLVAECKRQEEACCHTSTTLFEWLKSLRYWRVFFVVVPIVLGAVATWPLLAHLSDYQWITATCALIAGVLPAIYKALHFDVSLETVSKSAHQFKGLQDRFRQAANITALAGFDALNADFTRLMDQLDAARAMSLTAPERFFRRARKKIIAGHYNFAVDAPKQS